jgi:polyisoprenoid-binding protein YceI
MSTARFRTLYGALALAIALALGSSPQPSSASSARHRAIIELDPANTQINFTLTGFPHTTHGSFKLKSGTMQVDPDTGKANGSIVIDAATGTTGIGMRDREMRESILETQRYPEISFSPRRADGQPGPRRDFLIRVSGVMFLHGGQHDMTVELAIHRGGDQFTAAAHLSIPYVLWGLKDPSLLFLRVSDEVAIDVMTAGHVTWTPAQWAPP